MIQSRSAAGKSFLQDTVLSLIPEDEVIKYTRLTDQALFYKESDSLRHKILAIEELDGTSGAIYSIRSIRAPKRSPSPTRQGPGHRQAQDRGKHGGRPADGLYHHHGRYDRR